MKRVEVKITVGSDAVARGFMQVTSSEVIVRLPGVIPGVFESVDDAMAAISEVVAEELVGALEAPAPVSVVLELTTD
jgi:hypothetical protein